MTPEQIIGGLLAVLIVMVAGLHLRISDFAATFGERIASAEIRIGIIMKRCGVLDGEGCAK